MGKGLKAPSYLSLRDVKISPIFCSSLNLIDILLWRSGFEKLVLLNPWHMELACKLGKAWKEEKI